LKAIFIVFTKNWKFIRQEVGGKLSFLLACIKNRFLNDGNFTLK
jgi:hypothetical protein